VDPATLRERFRGYLGDDARFRRFIASCNDRAGERRLLAWWQEQLWRAFTQAHPEYLNLDERAISAAFHVCYVHFTPLHRVRIPGRRGRCIADVHAVEDGHLVAPYAVPDTVDSRPDPDATYIEVYRCDECMAVLRNR